MHLPPRAGPACAVVRRRPAARRTSGRGAESNCIGGARAQRRLHGPACLLVNPWRPVPRRPPPCGRLCDTEHDDIQDVRWARRATWGLGLQKLPFGARKRRSQDAACADKPRVAGLVVPPSGRAWRARGALSTRSRAGPRSRGRARAPEAPDDARGARGQIAQDSLRERALVVTNEHWNVHQTCRCARNSDGSGRGSADAASVRGPVRVLSGIERRSSHGRVASSAMATSRTRIRSARAATSSASSKWSVRRSPTPRPPLPADGAFSAPPPPAQGPRRGS